MTRTHTGRGRFARRIGMAAVVATTTVTLVVAAAGPANAAGPWFVSLSGSDANTCLSLAQACRTINGTLAKPGFVPGDTINVAAGTYTFERPSITKAVNIVGAGSATTIINASATDAARATTVVVNIPTANPIQTVSISGVTITGGRAPSFGGGGVFLAAGNLTITDSVVSGNVAGGTGVSSPTGGGGIYVLGRVFGTNPALTLNNVTVSGNQTNPVGAAVLPGGGIYTSGPLTMNNSTVIGNAVNGSGAGALGGGIYVNKLVAADTATVTATNSNVTFNGALFGGGVLVTGGSTYNQTGGSISNNAALSGGGLYVIGVGNNAAPGVSGSASLTGLTVSANTANGGAVANGGNGGGIFNAGSLATSDVTMTGNRTIASSAASLATGWGGGIFSGPVGAGDKPTNDHANLTVDGGGQNPNAVVGGGVAVAGNVFGAANVTLPTFTATTLTLTGNRASVGGAGAYLGVSATITGGSISGNVATSASSTGGGLWTALNPASSPPATITYTGAVDGNEAATGGGLSVGSNTSVAVQTGSTISSNMAAGGGGAIVAGSLTVAGSTIGLNQASVHGGGVWVGSSVLADAPLFTASDTDIVGNTAASSGGGVIAGARTTVVLDGSGSVTGNSATAGGGVYIGEGAAGAVVDMEVNENVANGLLGGGLVNSGTTRIENTTFAGNKALLSSANTGLGGAIYHGSNAAGNTASLVVERSTLSGNEAATASSIYSRSQGAGAVNQLSIRNSTISGNNTVGGWTTLVSFHPMTISTSTIVDNTSPAGFTGGLFIAGGSIGVAGSIISGNSGPGNCNAALVDGGFNLTDPGDATCALPPASRVDPQVNPLADNGGPTLTHLPTSTSPAINAIPPSTATGLADSVSGTPIVLCAGGAVDQRGVTRPQGTSCDIGSVEAELSAPTVDGPTNPVFTVGSAGTTYGYTSTGVPAPDLSVVGTLPTGLTFTDNGDGTGTLSGTAASGTAGAHPVTIVAANGVAPDDTLGVVIQINEAAAIQGPASATYTVGVPGGPTDFTTTGVPTSTLSTASDLPDGVTFTDNGDGTATIQGTPADGEGGVYAIVIDATNGVGDVAHHDFTLTVNEAPEIDGPASAAYEVGVAGGPTTFTSDGYPSATLSISGGPLPDGVTFTDNGDGTGSFSGTPADGSGGEYQFTVTAANGVAPDDSTAFTLTVNEAPEIDGPEDVRFVIGDDDTVGFSADGFPVAALSISGDALPSGLTFTDHGNGTATIAGTAAPGTAGTYEVTITASNGVDPDAELDVTIEVVEPVAITTTTLPDGTVGIPYIANIAADGGQQPYVFTVSSGSLPAGLTLATNGTISGTPTGPAGTSTFTVQVTDSLDPAQSDTQELSITIVRGPTQLLVDPVVLQTTGGLIKITVGRVSATLLGGSPAFPLAGQTITFRAGSTTVCTAVTAADGRATCTASVAATLALIVNGGVTATYAGSPSWLPASGSAGLL